MNREEILNKIAEAFLKTTECEHESTPSCCRYPKSCLCEAEEAKREEGTAEGS